LVAAQGSRPQRAADMSMNVVVLKEYVEKLSEVEEEEEGELYLA
jgi:hypothetical protein